MAKVKELDLTLPHFSSRLVGLSSYDYLLSKLAHLGDCFGELSELL